jgi:cytochrome c biogenesis protein ResB
MPSDFVSNMTVYDGGKAVLTQDARVNEYLGYHGVDFYQQDYGWAPHMVVRNPAGEVVSDTDIQMISDDKTASTGVLKVPDFNYTLPGQGYWCSPASSPCSSWPGAGPTATRWRRPAVARAEPWCPAAVERR